MRKDVLEDVLRRYGRNMRIKISETKMKNPNDIGIALENIDSLKGKTRTQRCSYEEIMYLYGGLKGMNEYLNRKGYDIRKYDQCENATTIEYINMKKGVFLSVQIQKVD